MKKLLALFGLLALCAPLLAQETDSQTPAVQVVTAPDANQMTQFGLTFYDFVQVSQTMTEVAQEDSEVMALTKQIEDLEAKREELLVAAASKKHPEVAVRIQTWKNKKTELKQKADAQAALIKAMPGMGGQ